MPYKKNQFLAKLPEETIQRLCPSSEQVSLTVGETIVQDLIDGVYFLLSGVVSFTITADDGAGMEVAVTGNEGFCGTSVFLNINEPVLPGVVRCEGEALRVPAKDAIAEFQRGTEFQALVFRYFRFFFMQVARISLCNAHHSLEKRLCRWLLMTDDRIEGDAELIVTQELISNLLGVRREAITRVIRQLKTKGLIDYGTRKIRVADREALIEHSCECYATLTREQKALTI